MKLSGKIIKVIFIFSVLTVLTQVGGLVYLLYLPFSNYVKSEQKVAWKRFVVRLLGYLGLYLSICLLIVPPVAKKYGRVALPIKATADAPIKAGNLLLYLTNRHYVKPILKEAYVAIAQKVAKRHDGAQLVHLDANFPFWDGFPLLPHLSHDDGEKLDIAFLYKNEKTKQFYNNTFSFIGYGVVERPRKGEWNQAQQCEKKGKWQYSLLEKITWSKVAQGYEFDEAVNRYLLQQIANHPEVQKIFIEPHLKKRMRLDRYKKIRFHGCHAVRHDDHIHFQL